MRFRMVMALACLGASLAWAQEATVSRAWVRGSVGGQNATGAFMEITAGADSALIGASSPAAKSVEIHEMAMEADVMKMRAVKSVALPAGKVVQFKPGGYHIMLIGLAKPLQKGETVPIELSLQGKDGKRSTLKIQAEVRELGAATKAEGHEHRH